MADTEGEPSTSENENRKIDDCELIENIQVNTKFSIIIIYTHPKTETGTPPPTKNPRQQRKARKTKPKKLWRSSWRHFWATREKQRKGLRKERISGNKKEEQTHQLNMIQMLGQMIRQPGPSQYYPPSSQPFNPDSQYDY